MSLEIVRAYNGSDDYMLETANTLHSIFITDIADFTALDTTLDAAFATAWLSSIDAAGTVVRDSQVKDIQAQKTNDVLAIMEHCKVKYNEVKYFVNKVFPKNKARQAEFGTDTYDEARRSQSKMIGFLDEMHKACVNHQPVLTTEGLTAPKIAEILTLRNNLLNANTNQENYIRRRPVLTQDRIILLNTCYNITRTVIEAAQVVYYNDIARRQQFVYLPSQDTDDSEVITLVLNNMAPVLVKTQPYNPERLYEITNNGPGNVVFFLSDSPGITSLSITIVPSSTLNIAANMLGTNGNNLYAMLTSDSSAQIEVVLDIE